MKSSLRHVAHVRSGDKGDTACIAVIAYSAEFYPLIKAQVTIESVRARYRGAVKGEIQRFEVDAIEALNFTMQGALGGGVSRSLAIDNYGKALAAALLDIEIELPSELRPLLVGVR